MTTADEWKAQGNQAFASKDYVKAVELFSNAIAEAPTNHVLYSNRSGAYAAQKQYEKALEDAVKTTELKPDWSKGWSRKGAALHGMGDLASAVDSYEEALKIDANNAQAKQGKESAEAAMSHVLNGGQGGGNNGQNPLTGLFQDPQVLQRLAANPKTASYLQDPSFMSKFQAMAANPMSVLTAGPQQQDPRLMEALSVALGIQMDTQPNQKDEPMPDAPKPASKEAPKPKSPESEVSSERAEADRKKAEANTLYKQRKFDEAIALYNEAWETCKDITYLNNRAAAEFEKGDYDATIATEKLAVEESQELHSDYKLVAKAMARIGTAYLKKDNPQEAVQWFENSLTEHRTPDVLTKLRSTQRDIRLRAEREYVDPAKAEEAREEGNKLFKEGDFPGSVKAYTEATKRDPKDPRGYGNRAAAFLKLMNYPDVIRDCDKALELDPNFFKAYTRKATALIVSKQYRKAMDTLESAREVDAEGKHSREIEELYQKALTKRFDYEPGENEEQRAERLSQDPEIDEIRRDPVMNTILQQAANDPAALRDHMKNPEVRRKINLLAAAGVIRTR